MAELRREIGEDHPLAETHRNAVDVHVRCVRCALTCVALRDGTFALVALDWSGRSDGRTFPRIEIARAEGLQQMLAAHSDRHRDAGARSPGVRVAR